MTDALSNDPNHFAAEKSLDAVAPRQEAVVAHLAEVLPQPDVIAMEEASVSFQRMVEVHNRLLDSYQELMRMRV
jgi:flagellar hook-basal body complex protein FliE